MEEKKAKFKVTLIYLLLISMLFLQHAKHYMEHSYLILFLPRHTNRTSGSLGEANAVNPFVFLTVVYYILY